jgi:transcriptional regulator with XRE-family HTH domain
MSNKVDIIQEVKIIMVKENLKQADLVKLWGITRQQVSLILKKESGLSIGKFELLLNTYNYTITATKEEKGNSYFLGSRLF